jgi:transcriptional regulator with XRE-family HTH domain
LSKDKLQLGEAFEAVRKIRAISALQLGKETGVAQSVISKFENNLSDLAISAYDKLVRRLGLTPDELIYIAYPPRQRWPLFLAYGAYLNHYMVETNVETCLDFSRLPGISQRAELMVGYRDWLAAEQSARVLTGNQAAVETPPVFERLKLWLLTLPQSPGRLKLAN